MNDLIKEIQFPQQPEGHKGWTILPEFLREISDIADSLPQAGMLCEGLSWEQVEVVLLALEKHQWLQQLITMLQEQSSELRRLQGVEQAFEWLEQNGYIRKGEPHE